MKTEKSINSITINSSKCDTCSLSWDLKTIIKAITLHGPPEKKSYRDFLFRLFDDWQARRRLNVKTTFELLHPSHRICVDARTRRSQTINLDFCDSNVNDQEVFCSANEIKTSQSFILCLCSLEIPQIANGHQQMDDHSSSRWKLNRFALMQKTLSFCNCNLSYFTFK